MFSSRFVLLTVTAAGVCSFGFAQQGSSIKSGKWEIVKLEREGKDDPSLVGAIRAHESSQYTITPRDGAAIKGTFKVDETASPKILDTMPASGRYQGKTLHGIYALEGDTLKICFATNPDAPRPREFASKPGYVLAIHKAVK